MKSTVEISQKRLVLFTKEVPALVAISALCFIFFWRMALTDFILPRGDAFTYFYPYWAYRNEVLSQGQIPLWNPYLFMGVPFLANSQAGVLYPFNWPLIWLDAPTAVKVAIVLHSILAATGTYIFARSSLNFGRAESLLAGVVFALGGYFTAQVEHVNQLQGLSWLPWAMWLGIKAIHTKLLNPIIALGIVLSLQLLAGHTQSTFITVFGLGLLAAWHVIRAAHGRLQWSNLRSWLINLGPPIVRSIGSIAVAVTFAAGLASAQLQPTVELTSLSNRSGGLPFIEAISFSLRPTLVGRALLPSFGESSLFTEYIAYPGIIALMLALVGGWAYKKDVSVGGLFFLAAAGLFLAFGAYNPIYWLLVKVIPGFQLFRAPARWLVLFAFGVACLSGAGAHYLIKSKSVSNRARLMWPAIIVLVLAILSPLAALESSEVIGATAPKLPDLVMWSASILIGGSLLIVSNSATHTVRRAAIQIAVCACILELLLASRSLPLNALTAPSAWTSQRPAISALLAAERDHQPPSRFLSMSDILFDPGDLRELRAVYGSFLDERQLYDYIVATKQKEILAPNLPLYWHVQSVDGFDGGILPTRDFNRFTQLANDDREPSPDGRLRENLTSVPALSWLRLTNTRWIITDKVYDAWIDSVYYDLQFSEIRDTQITPGKTSDSISAWLDYPFVATSIGIVGHIEPQVVDSPTTQIGEVRVYSNDSSSTMPAVVVPIDLDQSQPGGLRQSSGTPSKLAGYFDPEDSTKAEYQTLVSLGIPLSVSHVEIAVSPTWSGVLTIRGMTAIDSRDGSFSPMTLSASHELHLVQSGDVKIYEYSDTLPRAYLSCNALQVSSADHMWEAMETPMDASRSVVVDSQFDLGSCSDSAGTVQVSLYEPERVVFDVHATVENSYVVLSDSYYPGWQAEVDGKPTPILRANGLFRAIRMSGGVHTVEFTFVSKSFQLGAATSVIFVVAIVVFLVLRRE